MGYSLCVVAIFGHYQNPLIFRILAGFLEPFFAQNNSNMFVETFFTCFRQFYFLTQTEYFAWAIAFALWPFLAILKMLSLFVYYLFFGAVFLRRTTLLCLQKGFSHVLGNFIFWPKLSILHGLQPLHCGHFEPVSKCSHFSNISSFLERFFAWNNSNVFVETFFACFRQFYFLTQTEYFAWAIAFALWPF